MSGHPRCNQSSATKTAASAVGNGIARRVRADRLDALHSIHQSPARAGLHAADRVGELAELGIAVARTAAGPVAARKAGTTRTDCGIVSGNCAAARAVSR